MWLPSTWVGRQRFTTSHRKIYRLFRVTLSSYPFDSWTTDDWFFNCTLDPHEYWRPQQVSNHAANLICLWGRGAPPQSSRARFRPTDPTVRIPKCYKMQVDLWQGCSSTPPRKQQKVARVEQVKLLAFIERDGGHAVTRKKREEEGRVFFSRVYGLGGLGLFTPQLRASFEGGGGVWHLLCHEPWWYYSFKWVFLASRQQHFTRKSHVLINCLHRGGGKKSDILFVA